MCSTVVAQSSQEELSDFVGRIEYAFYSQDKIALKQTLDALAKADVDEARHAEQINSLDYGRWKLAQLYARDKMHGDAAELAEHCTDAIDTGKFSKQARAEHEALLAACYEVLAEVRFVRTLWYRGEVDEHLKDAARHDPGSLQVMFVDAWIRAHHDPGDPETYAALKKSVAAFADNAGRLQDTGWGYAEVLYLLGKTELARHDNLAARNALERALVIAPDYAAAQTSLKQLTVR